MPHSIPLNFWERALRNRCKKSDFCIVGAGFTGLSVAIAIKKAFPKAAVKVLEQYDAQSNASTRNAGFLCLASPSELLGHLDQCGIDKMSAMLQRRHRGFKMVVDNYAHHSLIQLQKNGGIEIFANAREFNAVADRMQELEELLEAAGIEDKIEVSEHPLQNLCPRALSWKEEAQIQPALLHDQLLGQAKELRVEICFNTYVESVEKAGAFYELNIPENSNEFAKTLILCTNALQKDLSEKSTVACARNHVLLSKEILNSPLRGNYHMDDGYLYLRAVGKRILIGGARNLDIESEMTYDKEQLNPQITEYLRSFVVEHLLSSEQLDVQDSGTEDFVEEIWQGFIGVQDIDKPLIVEDGNLLQIGGYNGLGVCASIQMGNEILENYLQ